VKAKRFLQSALLAFGLAAAAHGQIACPAASSVAIRESLVCVLPLTSADLGAAGATATALQNSLVTPFNAAFATQLTQLPVPTGTVGTVLLKDKNDPYGHSFDNLGPILTDRPETVGKGHLYAGFSYQHFDFDKIDTLNLSAFNIGYTYQQISSSNSSDLQTVYRAFANDISFQLDQYVALATLGVTQRTDISVVVPFNSVSVTATGKNFVGYLYDSVLNQWITEQFTSTSAQTNTGSASGIGDVTVSFKQMLHGTRNEGTPTAVSVGAAFRFPTGDALDYLGSGAYGVNAYGIFSYRSGKSRVSPHLKLSYQWNSRSVLVNPSTTTKTNYKLPGGAQYDGGADIKLFRTLTFAADLLGSQFDNTPSYNPETLSLTQTAVIGQSSPAAPPVATLPGVSVSNNTYSTANLSTGFKWQPHAGLLLMGNVTIPVNNAGLHSNPVPLFGIAYNFNLLRK
jgi:hypothetical protein